MRKDYTASQKYYNLKTNNSIYWIYVIRVINSFYFANFTNDVFYKVEFG